MTGRKERVTKALLRVAVALWVAGCGDGTTEPPVNRAPGASGSIPAQTLHVGESATVDLAGYFAEPDGDPLTYAATTSNPQVATVAVQGDQVRITAVAQGTATVNITATDPGGLSASQSLTVTVPNRAPEPVDSIPGLELFKGDTASREVTNHFTDPDGDPLTHTVATSDPEVATASAEGSRIRITAVAQGSATVTVTATDAGGLSASQAFVVAVPNRAPVVVDSIPGVEAADSLSLNLAAYFGDPDGDPLEYAAEVADSSIVTVAVADSVLTLTAIVRGMTSVTVTARDRGGLVVSQSFPVTVPNRAPLVTDTLPDVEIAGDSVAVDLSGFFADPDGDTLVFVAETADSAIAWPVVRNAVVTLNAARAGATTVTVTAYDPDGLGASQGFEVTVLNRAPVATDSIPGLSLAKWDSAEVDLSSHFTDPNGDTLRFTAEASDSAVAIASVSGSTVTIVAAGQGEADISVVATDPGGLSAVQSFRVTVRNRRPVVRDSIPDAELFPGDSVLIDLSAHFSDPDGDTLVFAAETSDERVAVVSLSGSAATVLAVGAGTANITVTATDPGGLAAAQTFAATVTNRPPMVTDSLPDVGLRPGESIEIDLTSHFIDPDRDTLVFAATTSDERVAIADVSGSTLEVTLVSVGTAEITVTARDPGGLGASQRFSVTPLNRAPVVTDPLPDRKLTGRLPVSIDLSSHFADPDGDSLGFAAETTHDGVVAVLLSESLLVLTPRARGNATITVTAEDTNGLAVTATFSATVPNGQPVTTESIRRKPLPRGGSTEIDLSAYFSDPDEDALRFSAETSDPRVATATVSGSRLTIRAVGSGTAEITLIGRDPDDLSVAHSFSVTVAPANPDRAALVALYEATGGPRWEKADNWLTSAPLGSWHGVWLDRTGRVHDLSLRSNSLSGMIPPEIGWLSELTSLSLGNNSLRGEIPAELGRLGNLTRLDLGENKLTGPIPAELGELANLTRLELDNNALSGPIPRELSRLGRLTALHLHDNRLTGSIPSELGQIPELGDIWLHQNNLDGSIPPQLGRLRNLGRLDLSGNDLTGPIPPELGNATRLGELRLGFNNLSGEIPPTFSRLRELRILELGFNSLTGPIPPGLGNLVHLQNLWLHHNGLTGEIPSELGRLSSLVSMWLHENTLTGSVPSQLGRMPTLRHLSLTGNRLTGALPRSLLESGRLGRLYLERNDGLCVPGVEALVAGIQALSVARFPYCHESDLEGLAALHRAVGGADWTNSSGWLGDPVLDGWHGVTTNAVGRVLELDLTRNGLAGALPPDLGNLLNEMTTLLIGDNDLSGPLPRSLAGTPLQELDYSGTNLCVPPDEEFRDWLNTLRSHRGTGMECPLLSDREILTGLYDATGGPNWTNRVNWLTDAPLDDWHGVETDAEGRVTHLNLERNNLSGSIPAVLGRLTELTTLRLGSNRLTGRIPAELAQLTGLTELDLSVNALTGRIAPELGSLAALRRLILEVNQLVGPIPPELGQLADLTHLHLNDNVLAGSIPREISKLSRLETLRLTRNDLTGRIPPEFGRLQRLTLLALGNNRLSGSIPPELGQAARLRQIWLWENRLTGPIPPELGGLINLSGLRLETNYLTGPIPPSLGELVGLQYLTLSENNLTGPIPGELGQLADLRELYLDSNNLTGPVPTELGNLADLRQLSLRDNDLTGSIPPELGNLKRLYGIQLSLNAGLSGALPFALTSLRGLSGFTAGGTGLCVPPDRAFLTWLNSIGEPRLASCVGTMAYLTQAVQSQEFPTPLVAGEEALLRVFVTAMRVTRAGMPPVRATFFLNDREVHQADIPGQRSAIQTRVDESSLSTSANALIPGHVLQPGLEVVIEVDPNGALDPSLGVTTRVPETGRLALDVRAMPPLDLTLIPFLWMDDPDPAIVDLVTAMAADPENHEMLWHTRTLLPVSDLAVTAHEPVLTSSNNAYRLADETQMIRAVEGGRGYYMGMMSGTVRGAIGLADAPGRVSFSIPDPGTMAHELGHNMSLDHAPCAERQTIGFLDPEFPQLDGSIGAWGYDFRDGGRLVDRYASDLMSYCLPYWISEYSFTKALRYRLRSESFSPAATSTAPARSLLLWGGADSDGGLSLEPAFVIDTRPLLPDSGGDYRLEGLSADGRRLFALDFDIPQVADGDGAGGFAFALPVQPGWEGALASITLFGPGASVTLNAKSDRSVTILLDTRSGQVRGILRDAGNPTAVPGNPAAIPGSPAEALSALRGVEVLHSRGIPDAEMWRR